ncbi:hypothetical protein HYFRA_00005820 [Hymenoscyphus fraxineus]|uniref:Uncharacterized protein n=1 Tax=Hymenoscyphus fraxineus TaxID=746836 RepID=A0A9N9PSI3_9HELO|nr:hypothetical protein HYFRA_00005820 [Hymenoscyphus fraxineus]
MTSREPAAPKTDNTFCSPKKRTEQQQNRKNRYPDLAESIESMVSRVFNNGNMLSKAMAQVICVVNPPSSLALIPKSRRMSSIVHAICMLIAKKTAESKKTLQPFSRRGLNVVENLGETSRSVAKQSAKNKPKTNSQKYPSIIYHQSRNSEADPNA